MRKLTASVLTLFLFLTPALAQETDLRAPSLRIGAGGALPVSDDLTLIHGAGPSFAAGLDVPISERLDVTVDVGYTRLLLDDDEIAGLFERALPPEAGRLDVDVSGGAYNFLSGTAGLKWTFATPGRAAFHLSGATGLFYSDISDPDLEVRDADGNEVGDGDVSVRGGDDTSFGFRVGAGVRVPVASGVRLFVEPRYTLVLEDSHYFSTQAGLAFDGLFDAAAPGPQLRKAPSPNWYEVSAGYRNAFFSDGDADGSAYRLEASRYLFTNWSGLAAGAAYHRAVNADLQQGLGWTKRRDVAVDLTAFADALRFTTGTLTHRLRLGAGLGARHRWGEQPRAVLTGSSEYPVDVDLLLQNKDYDRVRSWQEGNRTRYLFTEEYSLNELGWGVEAQYQLVFGRITAGPRVSWWTYDGGQVLSYGVHIGVPFGPVLD